MLVKFTFHFKNGKEYVTYERLTITQFNNLLYSCKNVLKEGEGIVILSQCVISMSEVVLLEWEEIDEQEE